MDFEIIDDFSILSNSKLNHLIDFSKLSTFAKTHSGSGCNIAEFVRESTFTPFSTILQQIRTINLTAFSILWDLNCCYRSKMEINCRYVRNINKQELLQLLEEQLEDMDGEELCFAKEIHRIPYWDMLIFDESYTWCMAITHEDLENGNRMCFSTELPKHITR